MIPRKAKKRTYFRPDSVGTKSGLGITGKAITEDQLNLISDSETTESLVALNGLLQVVNNKWENSSLWTPIPLLSATHHRLLSKDDVVSSFLNRVDGALYRLQKQLAEMLGIPEKCRHPAEEVSMHLDYIQNNLWETRDMKRAHEIRDRYSKEGNIMCVYKFENLINGKVYIGQTKNFWNRVKKHLSPKSLNYDKADLYRAIRKHGIENFEVSILYDSLQVPRLSIERERLLMEAVMVERYDSFINGYNVQPTTTDPHERHKIATDPRYRKTYRSLSYDQL